MATPWERAQISSPVYEHTKRSRGLVQRLRWGQRLQDAAAEEQLLEEARRRPRFRPATAPSARSGSSNRSNYSDNSASEAPVSAAAIALASVPSTLKEQLAKDAELKELAKLRWQAIAAAGPLFVQHSKGLQAGGQGNIVNEVAHAASAKGRLDDRIADDSEFYHESPNARYGQTRQRNRGACRDAQVNSSGSGGDGAGGAVTSLAHALNDVAAVPSVYSRDDAGSGNGGGFESLVFDNSTVQGKEANRKANAQQAVTAATGAMGGPGGGNSSSASSAAQSPHHAHHRHPHRSSSSAKRPRYEAGCPVYFGSVLSLRSTHHGGFLAADGGRHCDASAANPFGAFGTAPLPPQLLLDPEAVAEHETAVAAVAAAHANGAGLGLGDEGRKSTTPALFTIWSGDGNVGEAEGENATDGMGGMLRYGDAVFLQCGTHKASSLLENPPTSAAAPKGVGHSNHKSGGGKKSQQSHAKLLGCSAMAADAPVIVERAVQTYHNNRASHAFAFADARSADHARLALKGVSPRVIHGLGAGSNGGAETEGLTRQAYARLMAKRAEETAKQRRKAVAESRTTQPAHSSANDPAHPPPGSRLVAIPAATDGDHTSGNGNGNGGGKSSSSGAGLESETTKREAHWRAAARWVVKPGPTTLAQGAQLGDEVKHGDAVVLEQAWGAITSRRPHNVALESKAASLNNHLQPLSGAQSPVATTATAAAAVNSPVASGSPDSSAPPLPTDGDGDGDGDDGDGAGIAPATTVVDNEHDPSAPALTVPATSAVAPAGAAAAAVVALVVAASPEDDAPDTSACVWQVELVYLPHAAPMERARQAQLADAALQQAEGAQRQQGCVAASNALAGAFREEATRLVETQLKGPEKRLLQLDHHLRSRYMDVARTNFDFEENVPLRSPQSLAKVYGPTSSFAIKADAKAKKDAADAARHFDALTQFRQRLPLKTRQQLTATASYISSSSELVDSALKLEASHRSKAAADAADAAERLAAEIWYKQAPDAWRLLTNVMDAVAVLLRCARRYLARKRDRYPFRGHKWHVGMAGEDEDLQGKWFRALTQGGKTGALKAAIEETEVLRRAKLDAIAREEKQRTKANARMKSVMRASMIAVSLSSGGAQGKKSPLASGSAAAKLFNNQPSKNSSGGRSTSEGNPLKSSLKKEAKNELEAEETEADDVDKKKMDAVLESEDERGENQPKASLLRLEIPSSPEEDHHLHHEVVTHPETTGTEGNNSNNSDGKNQCAPPSSSPLPSAILPSHLASSTTSSERVVGAHATIPGLGSRPSLPSQSNHGYNGGSGLQIHQQSHQEFASSLAGSYQRFAAAAEAKDSLTEKQAIALLAQDFPDHFQGFKLLKSRQRTSPKPTLSATPLSSVWSQHHRSIENKQQDQHQQSSKVSTPTFKEDGSIVADSAAPLLVAPSLDAAEEAPATGAAEAESKAPVSSLVPAQVDYRVFGHSALDSRDRAPPPQITRPRSASLAARFNRRMGIMGQQLGQEQQPHWGNQLVGASSGRGVGKTMPKSSPKESKGPITPGAITTAAAAPAATTATKDGVAAGELGDAHASGQAALAHSAATQHGLLSPALLAAPNTSLRHPAKGELALHVVPRFNPTARGSIPTPKKKNNNPSSGKSSKPTKRPSSAPAPRSHTIPIPTALQGQGVHRMSVQAFKSSPRDSGPESNPFMSPGASVSTGPSFSGLLATQTPPQVKQQQQPQQELHGQQLQQPHTGEAKLNAASSVRPRSANATPRTPLSGVNSGGGGAAAAARRSTRPLSAQSTRGDKKQFTTIHQSPSPSQNFASVGRSALPATTGGATGAHAVAALFPGPSATMRVAPFTPLESLGKPPPTYDPTLSGTGYTNRARPRSSSGPRGDSDFEATNRWQAGSPTNVKSMQMKDHSRKAGGIDAAGVGNTRAAPGGKVLQGSNKAVVIDGGCLTPSSHDRR